MKDKIILHVIICCCIAMLMSCNNSNRVKEMNTSKCRELEDINYVRTIRSIGEEFVDLTWMFEPLQYEVFKPIYENPECFIDSAKSVIQDVSVSSIDKQIALLSMHRLPLEGNISFTRFCFNMYSQSKLTENDMNLWVGGAYGNKTMVNNSKNSEVRALLQEIRDADINSEKLVQTIERILKN